MYTRIMDDTSWSVSSQCTGIPISMFRVLVIINTQYDRKISCVWSLQYRWQKCNLKTAIFGAGKMGRLSENQRSEAIGMLRAGRRQGAVAAHFNCTRLTINRLEMKYQQTGAVKDLPRSGRPRVLTRRQDVNVRTSHLRRRLQPAAATARTTRGLHGYVSLRSCCWSALILVALGSFAKTFLTHDRKCARL